MRHINGVYTQRHNQMKRTDGPLFKGRYKAVLIEEKAYLLKLTRYVHYRPVESKLTTLETLDKYLWSSYSAYISQVEAPAWLTREKVYTQLKKQFESLSYFDFIAQGIDQDIQQFYGRRNTAAVIGGKTFLSWLTGNHVPELDEKSYIEQVFPKALSVALIIQSVSKCYKQTPASIVKVSRGPQKGLVARNVAIYLCQQLAGFQLKDIMTHFGLTNIGSVSFITSQVRKRIQIDPEFSAEIDWMKKYIINNAV